MLSPNGYKGELLWDFQQDSSSKRFLATDYCQEMLGKRTRHQVRKTDDYLVSLMASLMMSGTPEKLMPYEYGARTHVGRREINQDSYVCDPEQGLWIVADGVGGLAMGETASAITTYALERMIAAGEGVNQAIEQAHLQIREHAESLGSDTNMGAALVLALTKGFIYNIFWAGDCRAYLFDGALRQLTRDHTHSQYLIDRGELTPEEAASDSRKDGITKAVGIRELETVRADRMTDKWRPGQKILLCSDGLSGYVSDDEIRVILNTSASDQDSIDRLIETALAQGSLDNVTAILVSAPDSTPDEDDDTEIPEREVLEGLVR